MRFSKMHGAGNDFVVLDHRDGRASPTPELCRGLADRHFGVGCDQILVIEPARDGALAAYAIFNADGSRAGQCGNGARCVAVWLDRDARVCGNAHPTTFELQSPSGAHAVQLEADGQVQLDMGQPQFDPARVPLAGFSAADEYHLTPHGLSARFAAVSMGNPHAVIRVDDVERAPVLTVGPALQRDAAFPESVNVGFAQRIDAVHLRLRVYERGVGETLACGSGACAAAVVFMRRGLVERSVRVQLPGGELRVDWPSNDATVTMTGPAAFVFEGEWPDD